MKIVHIAGHPYIPIIIRKQWDKVIHYRQTEHGNQKQTPLKFWYSVHWGWLSSSVQDAKTNKLKTPSREGGREWRWVVERGRALCLWHGPQEAWQSLSPLFDLLLLLSDLALYLVWFVFCSVQSPLGFGLLVYFWFWSLVAMTLHPSSTPCWLIQVLLTWHLSRSFHSFLLLPPSSLFSLWSFFLPRWRKGVGQGSEAQRFWRNVHIRILLCLLSFQKKYYWDLSHPLRVFRVCVCVCDTAVVSCEHMRFSQGFGIQEGLSVHNNEMAWKT